jgi:DNA-binding transcriptional ArsR family regulator
VVDQSFHVTDPSVLRALAHPLRQRLIWELSVRKYGRAADLARVIDEPANTLSYHLRALAKVGIVEEAPEFARDSRDRVWRMSHPEGLYAEAGSPAADILVEEQLGWIREFLYERIPVQDGAARSEYLGAAMLTKAEAKEMFMELAEILERWRLHGAEVATVEPDDPTRIFHRMVFLLGNR